MPFDQDFSLWIAKIGHGNEFLGQLMKFFSIIAEGGIIWILVCVAYLIYTGIRKKKLSITACTMLVTLLVGYLINDQVIKKIVNRPRPFMELEVFKDYMISIRYSFPHGASFPSGHSCCSFEMVMMLGFFKKKSLILALPLALIIAFSRIFLGAHYLSDVLCGMLLGLTIGLGQVLINQKVLNIEKVKEWKYAAR